MLQFVIKGNIVKKIYQCVGISTLHLSAESEQFKDWTIVMASKMVDMD